MIRVVLQILSFNLSLAVDIYLCSACFLQKNEGDIMVTEVRCVAPDFHARYKALERT